jgi:hypothetical protein
MLVVVEEIRIGVTGSKDVYNSTLNTTLLYKYDTQLLLSLLHKDSLSKVRCVEYLAVL